MVTTQLVTAEELERLPDAERHELIRRVLFADRGSLIGRRATIRRGEPHGSSPTHCPEPVIVVFLTKN